MGADGIISRQQSGAVSYYLKNAHGDIVYTLNDSRTKTATYKYSAWGETMDEYDSNTSSPNPIKYSGEYEDSESGMIYLRGRYYDPELRRFITEDPAKDGLNWYAYCGNNPVMYVDPWGEDAIILTNENGVDGLGHMGVIVQDCNGTWVYFSCGENYSIWVAVDPQYMTDIETFSDNYYAGRTYTTSTYIKGDFTDSCNYYYEYNEEIKKGNNQYKVFYNNCSQVREVQNKQFKKTI